MRLHVSIYQSLGTKQGQFFKRSFPSARSVARPKLKNPVCPTILPRVVFIPFPRVFALRQRKTASYRHRTRVSASISCNDIQYITSALVPYIYIYIYITLTPLAIYNTQYQEVRIKGKVEQSREKGNVFPYTSL